MSNTVTRKDKLAAIWKAFRLETTAHGIPHVSKAQGTLKRIFWIIISVACVAILTYHMVAISIYYSGRPVSVNLNIIRESKLDFPAVTICNMNAVKSSAVPSSPSLNSVLNGTPAKRRRRAVGDIMTYGGTANSAACVFPFTYLGTTVNEPYPWCSTTSNYIGQWGFCLAPEATTTKEITTTEATTTEAATTTPEVTTEEATTIPEIIYSFEQDFNTQEKVFEVLANMPDEEKRALGIQSEEFILDCQYGGRSCNISTFNYFYDPMHGNCYIFNANWNKNGILRSSRPGRRHGLKIILNINQKEYLDNLGESAGVSVAIHSQNSMPFPQDSGILATPGHLTAIGLTMVSLVVIYSVRYKL